jgi:hypothetical protein
LPRTSKTFTPYFQPLTALRTEISKYRSSILKVGQASGLSTRELHMSTH